MYVDPRDPRFRCENDRLSSGPEPSHGGRREALVRLSQTRALMQ
jgi:hypothetical protein